MSLNTLIFRNRHIYILKRTILSEGKKHSFIVFKVLFYVLDSKCHVQRTEEQFQKTKFLILILSLSLWLSVNNNKFLCKMSWLDQIGGSQSIMDLMASKKRFKLNTKLYVYFSRTGRYTALTKFSKYQWSPQTTTD